MKLKIIVLKTFQTIFIILCLCSVSFGQDKQDHKLIIGVHGAPAGAIWWGNRSFKKDFGTKYKPRKAFVAGVSILYNFKPRFALNVEVNYESKGCLSIDNGVLDDKGNYIGVVKQEEISDYVTLPITAKIKLLAKKKIEIVTNIGFYTAYLIKDAWYVYPYGNYQGRKTEINPNTLHRIDFGLVTGLGFDIPIKEHFQITLELRNNFGLAPITKGITYENEHPKNETFGLLLGIAYKL